LLQSKWAVIYLLAVKWSSNNIVENCEESGKMNSGPMKLEAIVAVKVGSHLSVVVKLSSRNLVEICEESGKMHSVV